MAQQILISQIQGRTLCIPISSADNLSTLKSFLHQTEGIHPDDQRLLYNSKDIEDNETFCQLINSENVDFLNLKFLLKGGCTGGKGGFGSLLRSAKSAKKTTNFGSCRDLNGRKHRDVQYEKKILEWNEKQREEEKKGRTFKNEENVKKGKKREEEEEEEGTIIREVKENDKKRKMEQKEKDMKNITTQVGISVEKGLAIQKEKEELKRKREEAPIKLFGMEDDISETDSEENESEDEIVQKSKRHCSANIIPTTSTEITINS